MLCHGSVLSLVYSTKADSSRSDTFIIYETVWLMVTVSIWHSHVWNVDVQSISCNNYREVELAANVTLLYINIVLLYFNTVTPWWEQWRLKSPGSRLFGQPFVLTQIKENIKASCHWTFEENPPVTGEFPSQRASNTENVFILWRHHVDFVIHHAKLIWHPYHKHSASYHILQSLNIPRSGVIQY